MSKCRHCRWRDALATAEYGLTAAAAYWRETGGGRFSRGRRSDDWPMLTTPFSSEFQTYSDSKVDCANCTSWVPTHIACHSSCL